MLKKLNHKLENLFDDQLSQSSPEIPQNATRSFEPVKDINLLENLSYIFTQPLDAGDLHKLMSRLSCFFPFGLMLHTSASEARTFAISHYFADGKIASLETESQRSIKLPNTPIYTVLSTSTTNVITRLKLPLNIQSYIHTTCYLITLSKNYSLIVCSDSAEPWAALEIEALQQTLMKINFSL